MPKIGAVTLGEIPRVVFSVWKDASALKHASHQGVDMFEFRVDRCPYRNASDIVDEARAIRRHGLPVIGTVRSRREGGAIALAEAKRLALYERIAPFVDAIDIELSSRSILRKAIGLARRYKLTQILSFHDFARTPPTTALERTIKGAASLGADVIKLATWARTPEDVARLFDLTLRHRRRNLVTVAMGTRGSISRLLFPLAGSLLTYTSVSPSDGQLPLKELVQGLRLWYPKYNAKGRG